MTKRRSSTVQRATQVVGNTASRIGLLASLLSVGAVAIWLWDRGWVEALIPQPKRPDAVVIRLYGPAETLLGGEYFFHVEIEGSAGRPVWKLIPETPAALTVFPDGCKARFQSTEEGAYSVQVAVAGDGLQVASDHLEFVNLAIAEIGPLPEFPVPLAQTTPPTVAELTLLAMSSVDAAELEVEANVVAGSFKSVIGRIQTGLVAPETDVVVEAQKQAEVALGERFGAWRAFFGDVRAIVYGQPGVTTAATTIRPLAEVSAVLMQVQ